MTHLHRSSDTQEVDEPNTLVPDNLHLIDQSEAVHIIPQSSFRQVRVQPSDKNVPRSLGQSDPLDDIVRNRRRFAPTDLKLLTSKRELLDGGVGVEGGGGGSIEEGDENTRLLGEEADGFDGSEANEVEKFIDSGV